MKNIIKKIVAMFIVINLFGMNVSFGAEILKKRPVMTLIEQVNEMDGCKIVLVAKPATENRGREAANDEGRPGHVYIILKGSDFMSVVGYSPTKPFTILNVFVDYTVKGKVHIESKDQWSVAKVYDITPQQARDALKFIKRYNKSYNLLNNNCIHFSLEVLDSIGIEVKEIEERFWTIPNYFDLGESAQKTLSAVIMAFCKPLYGYTPSDIAHDLKDAQDVIVAK